MTLLLMWACGDSTKPPTNASDDTHQAPADSGGADDTAEPIDLDGDGYTSGSGDCDDEDPAVHPGAAEACNGVDDDCDGVAEADADQDGTLDCRRCDEAGYWLVTRGVQDETALLSALEATWKDDACKDYAAAREFLFLSLDNTNGSIEGLYTGAAFDIGDTLPDWSVVNTEHVWPRSAGAEVEPQECDLHHLFPADADANNRRGSLPFGEVVSAEWSQGGSLAGEDSSGVEVFEPRDAKKGDVARAMLYFSIRYSKIADLEAQRSAAQVAVFQRWHTEDPPDEGERSRSAAIAAEQGQDNLFVVCPELAELL